MASRIDPSLPPGIDATALRAAQADEAKAYAAQGSDTEIVVTMYDPHRLYAGSVEHTRQSRLQRWQRLP